MRLNLDTNILRHMSDGVVVLDRHGKVVSFNRTGEPWVPYCRSLEIVFRRMIEEERQGHLQLPMDLHGLTVRLTQDAKPGLLAWLCKNGQAEYAVFLVSHEGNVEPVSAPAPDPAPGAPRPQFSAMALLGGDVSAALRQLGAQLAQLSTGNTVPPDWVHQSQRVLALIGDAADLGTLAGRDEVFADERIDLVSLLAQASEQLGPEAGPHYIRLHADVSTVAPVYGNAAWLGYALRSLLQSLLHSSDYRCAIHLAVKPLGNFVVVSGHVANPLPEGQAAVHRDLHDAHTGKTDWTLRELLWRRIVDLHAGKLKLTMNPDATPPQPGKRPSLDAFTLTLMTGLPDSDRSRASCQNCRHVQQELAYAADLARVLSASPPLNSGDPHHAQDTYR